MAKAKRTRSTGADAKGANETAPKNRSMETADFPNLDDSALATLTQRIEKKLQDRSGTTKASAKTSERPVLNSQKKRNIASENQVGKKQNLSKGKKRNRNGDVINSKEETGKKADDKNETLWREIQALGGGEEDYNMLIGVDSESELEYHADVPVKSQRQPSDGILRKELAKMLKETGEVEVKIRDQEEDDGNMDSDGNSSDVKQNRLSKDAKDAPKPRAIVGGGPSKGGRSTVPKKGNGLDVEQNRLSEDAKDAPKPRAIAGEGPSKGGRNTVPKRYSKLVGRLVSIAFYVFLTKYSENPTEIGLV